MPINRNAWIRYQVIDRCLRDHSRYWTLKDLQRACSDAVTEAKGATNLKEIGERTIQGDIRAMRYSQDLKFFAPIIVTENKYYSYENRDYSITKVPLGKEELLQLSEAVDLLKQMFGFSVFSDCEDIVNKLEDHVLSMRFQTEPVIQLETNIRLKGLNLISTLHEAIVKKRPVQVTYCPFETEENRYLIFSPYVLKEYRNRWFVIGGKKVEGCLSNPPIRFLALDRIVNLEIMTMENYLPTQGFNAKDFFKDRIGLSNYDRSVEIVRFMADRHQTPYLTTKPIHESQQIVATDNESGWTTFEIRVIINPELIREIMGVVNHIKVLEPQYLVEEMKQLIRDAANLYD